MVYLPITFLLPTFAFRSRYSMAWKKESDWLSFLWGKGHSRSYGGSGGSPVDIRGPVDQVLTNEVRYDPSLPEYQDNGWAFRWEGAWRILCYLENYMIIGSFHVTLFVVSNSQISLADSESIVTGYNTDPLAEIYEMPSSCAAIICDNCFKRDFVYIWLPANSCSDNIWAIEGKIMNKKWAVHSQQSLG